jgi:hypothetical protein
MGSGSGIRDPGSGKNLSRIQGSKRHRIPGPDPQHCFNLFRDMESGQVSHSDKILSALLTEMDGMGGKIQEEFSSGRIFILVIVFLYKMFILVWLSLYRIFILARLFFTKYLFSGHCLFTAYLFS